jgi:RNA polymerase sigma-70 factor, ECF subfamily
MRSGPLSQQTDEQLAALGRGGSDDAFAEIVRRYEPVLRAKCTRIAGRDLADDALSQTWLQTFAALRRPRHPPVLQPWLHRVAYNCAIDQVRARRQQESLTPPSAQASNSPEAELERKQSVRDLLRGLSTLPENQRDALVLREFEGWSYAQIAEWVEEPPSGIHQLIFRARSALRRGICVLAPWTPARTLAQQLSALTPGGGTGSLRFGLAVIGTALIGGGTITPSVTTGSGDGRAVESGSPSSGEAVRHAPSVARDAPGRGKPFVALPEARGPRSETMSFRLLVWRDQGGAPEAPAELVSGEAPAAPETASPTAPGGGLAPSEPAGGSPAAPPAPATPAADPPDEDVPEPVVTEPPAAEPPTDPAPAPDPVQEEPVVTEPVPDSHPGRGHGPPAWAPSNGHGKHGSA